MTTRHALQPAFSQALKSRSQSPVTATFRNVVEGGAEVSISVDYTKADPPEFNYVADYFDVRVRPESYVLLFGKLNSNSTALRTMIEITFAGRMFREQFLASTRNFIELHARKYEFNRTVQALELPEPDRLQSLRSNNAFLGLWGDEGVMDFYYMSPSDFTLAMQVAFDIRLQPVVRVTMEASLIRDVIVKCHSLAENHTSTNR